MRWNFRPSRALTTEEVAALEAIAGVRVKRSLSVPENAISPVRDLLQAWSVTYTFDIPVDPQRALIKDASQVRASMRAEVPGYGAFPDFLMPWQRAGLAASMKWPETSGLLHWATGCLTGDAEVVVNRGGASRRMRLDDLVNKFTGGKAINGHRWDLSVSTMVQSIDSEGFLRLNRVEQVHSNGIKPVFCLRAAGGFEITATADHRFLRPDGSYTRLQNLGAGDLIMVEAWPKKGTIKTPKPRYREIDGMWKHPHVVRKTGVRQDRQSFRRQAVCWEHRLIAEASINQLTLAEFVGRIILGQIDGLKFLDPAKFHVHHINGDSLDNRAVNLEVKPAGDHLSDHGRESGWRHVAGRVTPAAVESITSAGDQPTYDLSLAAPMNNYVANGFAVHNSGKSLGAILWALCSPARVIVITKAAVKYQWAGEVRKFTNLTPVVLEGERPSQIAVDAQVVILNYDILPAWLPALGEWTNWLQLKPSLVIDESQTVQSHKRWTATVDTATVDDAAPTDSGPLPEPKVRFSLKDNIAASMMRLAGLTSRRLLTTATPISDRVRNLWAQLDLAHPAEWGGYWDWAKRYCAATEGTFGGMDDSGSSNLAELKQRLSVSLHRVKHEEANALLPPMRRIVSYIPIQEQVKAVGFGPEIRAALKAGNPTLVREVLLMEAAGRKRRWLTERARMLLSEGQKVVIFTGRRRDCDDLLAALAPAAPLVVGGHGGHSAKERDAAKNRYMAATGPALLIGTMDAWGEGLNLQDSDRLIMAMLPYVPKAVVQCEGRVCRLGQTRPVIIEYGVCEGTIDERVSEILLTKLPALEKVLDQDEIKSFGRQLVGADDPGVMEALAMKILGSGRKREAE